MDNDSAQDHLDMVVEVLQSLEGVLRQVPDDDELQPSNGHQDVEQEQMARKRRLSWRSPRHWHLWKKRSMEGSHEPSLEESAEEAFLASLNMYATPLERLEWCISRLNSLKEAKLTLESPLKSSVAGSGLLMQDDEDVSDEEKTVVAGLQRIYTEENRDKQTIASRPIASASKRSASRSTLRRTTSETRLKMHLQRGDKTTALSMRHRSEIASSMKEIPHGIRARSATTSPTPGLERASRVDAARRIRRSPTTRHRSPRLAPLEENETDSDRDMTPSPPMSPTLGSPGRRLRQYQHGTPRTKRSSRLSSVQSYASSDRDVFPARSSPSPGPRGRSGPRVSHGTFDNIGLDYGPDASGDADAEQGGDMADDDDVELGLMLNTGRHKRRSPSASSNAATPDRQQQHHHRSEHRQGPHMPAGTSKTPPSGAMRGRVSPQMAAVKRASTHGQRPCSVPAGHGDGAADDEKDGEEETAAKEARDKLAGLSDAERRESLVQQVTAALNTNHMRGIARSMTMSSPKARRRPFHQAGQSALAAKSASSGSSERNPTAPQLILRKQRSLEDIHRSAECGTVDEDTRMDNLDRFKKLIASIEDPISDIIPTTNPKVMELLLRSDRWDLDIFRLEDLTAMPLTSLGLKHICDRRLPEKLPINLDTCARFLHRIEHLYKPYPENHYHTNTHGADVMHVMACLLDSVPYFTPTEAFAAIIAAAVHDVGHPGHTNTFLMKTGHEFAILYNDRSILENFHAATTFQIMRDHPDCNILANFSNDEQKTIRRLIIDMVLGTDMTLHMNHVKSFQAYSVRCAGKMEDYDHMEVPSDMLSIETTVKERSFVLEYMLHCADLSACTKPWHQCYKWAYRVLNEFWLEGDEEKRRQLPVGDLNDRNGGSVPAGQYGFLKFVCHPLWKGWNSFVSPDAPGVFMTNLEANMALWEARKEYEGHKSRSRHTSVSRTPRSASPKQHQTVRGRQSSRENGRAHDHQAHATADDNRAGNGTSAAGGAASSPRDKNKDQEPGDNQTNRGAHEDGGCDDSDDAEEQPRGRKMSRGAQALAASQSKNQAIIPRRRSQPLVRMGKLDADDGQDGSEHPDTQDGHGGGDLDRSISVGASLAQGGRDSKQQRQQRQRRGRPPLRVGLGGLAEKRTSEVPASQSTSAVSTQRARDAKDGRRGSRNKRGGGGGGIWRLRRPQRTKKTGTSPTVSAAEEQDSEVAQSPTTPSAPSTTSQQRRKAYAVEIEMQDGVPVYTTEV